MSAVPVAEAGIWLEIAEATAYAGRPIQVSINNLDEKGAGYGSRLAGPKFTCSGSRLLRRIRVDAAFVKEIQPYLDLASATGVVPQHDATQSTAPGGSLEAPQENT